MRVEQLLAADRFAALLGTRLVEASPGRLIVQMDVADHHRDASGAVSSGVLFSLADCAMSLISNAEARAVAVTTHFARTGRQDTEGETITAEARPELPAREDEATTWRITLTAGGAVVAAFTGTTLPLD